MKLLCTIFDTCLTLRLCLQTIIYTKSRRPEGEKFVVFFPRPSSSFHHAGTDTEDALNLSHTREDQEPVPCP